MEQGMRTHLARITGALAVLVLVPVLGAAGAGVSAASPRPAPLAPTPVATNLQIPWNAAFLPDGTALVTERATARILSLSPAGKVTVVQQLSQDVRPRGEGGLLGLAVSPDYQADGLVYVYYTTATDNRIGRMRLGQRPEPILTGIPAANNHDGGRIAFGPDGMLYAGTGDATNPDNSQDPASLGGKILRMTPTGAPADGNPFPGSVVWSLGHRNVQGLAWDAAGRMYASELGQDRFDEFNRIEPGANYGWPEVEGTGDDPRYVNPLLTWSTDDASPSGLAIRGDDAYMACLGGEKVYRITLDGAGGVAGTPEPLFAGQFGRIRQVVVEPAGTLLMLTSNRDGRGTVRPGDDKIIRFDG
jgi:glucose/arabinose dehydrogenase